MNGLSEKYINVSHGLGVPFGGIGTGYFVFGRHGFVNVNLDGYPEAEQTDEYPYGKRWDYTEENPDEAPFALYAEIDGERYLLQGRKSSLLEGGASEFSGAYAFMPFGRFYFKAQGVNFELLMYSSVKPYDLERTSIPACIIEYRIINSTDKAKNISLGFDCSKEKYTVEIKDNILHLSEASGNMSFGFANADAAVMEFEIKPKETKAAEAALAWYYPEFTTKGLARNDIMLRHHLVKDNESQKNRSGYLRNYINRYLNSAEVLKTALANGKSWAEDIDRWHNGFELPAYISRILFGSFASVITSSLYTTEGYFFEIEQPHGCLNTMDVSVYSCWLYMINWPMLETTDLYQYINTVPLDGPYPGKVWHSLWADAAHYVEEAIYALRVWRYVLWSRDKNFARDAFASVKAALEHIYKTEGCGALIENIEGNQSYDAWKMPGIGAYVNVQWIYALFAFERLCNLLGEKPELLGHNLKELRLKATEEYNNVLWDEKEGYWHAYKTTEKSVKLPFGDAVFADQLFGYWAVCIDPTAKNVLNPEMQRRALKKIYTHNRLEETEKNYSCWLVGMLPEKEKTPSIHKADAAFEECGYHAICCWLSTEMEMASLMYRLDMETEGKDVFYNVSKGVGDNAVAAGEYNRGLADDMTPETMKWEPGKDTPRFPPYPRYKSSWEHIITLLGMELDMDNFFLKPAKNVELHLEKVQIAGTVFTITLKKNWTRCLLNGKESNGRFSRDLKAVDIKFI